MFTPAHGGGIRIVEDEAELVRRDGRRQRSNCCSGYAGLMTSGTQIAAGTAGLSDGEPGAVIHTEDLTKVYGGTDFTAVDKLNLDVEAGEIFGLLGPNGAGKTTTAGCSLTSRSPNPAWRRCSSP